MNINGKPCIVISNQGKRFDKLWTTLMHELYHVLNDYEYIQKVSYHISDENASDIFVDEASADKFASYAILGEQKLEIAAKAINYPYKIQMIADKLNIHSSLIYGLYLNRLAKKDQKIEYPKYRKYLISSTKAINNIIYDPIKFKEITEAVESIKEQYRYE